MSDMIVRRPPTRFIAILLSTIILTGCGTSSYHHTPTGVAHPVAVAGQQAILSSDVNAYATYSLSFFGWSTGKTAGDTRRCLGRFISRECAALRVQILRRLIEESIVMRYAATHHIGLAANDNARIDDEMVRLEGGRSSSRSFFASVRVSPQFVRSLLSRQIIVQKVVQAIAPRSALRGLAWHVRKLTFPDSQLPEAVRLVATRLPVVTRVARVDQWVAPVHLSTKIRAKLSRLAVGKKAGPFEEHGTLVVYEMLGSAVRRFGKPARMEIRAEHFRAWLRHAVHITKITCFNPAGNRVTCPIH